MEVFNSYAAYYDLLYKDKDYKGEVDYITQLIQKNHPKAKTILDLGCGTGKHDFYLAEKGYQVDGIDFSQSMIEIAKKKLDDEYSSHKKLLFFQEGDVRSVRTEKKYDVVVSLFHVISYHTTNEDLIAAFQTAKEHLNPGGIFIFDFWYGPGVLTDPPVVRIRRLEDDRIQVTRLAEPVLHSDKNFVDVNYNLFIKNKKSGLTIEMKELHEMRYFFLPELIFLSSLSEFEIRNSLEWMVDTKPTMKTWNAVQIWQKK